MAVGQLRGVPVVSHVRIAFDSRVQIEIAAADIVIGISDFVSSTLKRRDLPPKTIRTIYNGLDLSLFSASDALRLQSRKTFGFAETDLVISMVGRITPRKQQHLLIETLPSLQKHIPDLHAVFSGDVYDQHYFHGLREFVFKLGLQDRVHWLGFRPSIQEVYAASDVLIVCTVFEPFGRCIIEAMAMGIPCIVPKSGGPAEIVRAGIDGLAFDPQSADSLTRSLVEMLSNKRMRATFSHAARQRALRFDIRQHVREVQGLYDELLSRTQTDWRMR
jgi:glycosyltransferase involved in cell wall biosynthesis